MKRPLALLILDGWGNSDNREGNAIALANTPNYDEICAKYPMTLLQAAGERVGLPQGSVGTSERGHLSIGSGRVIKSEIGRINHAIETGKIYENKVLLEAMKKAKKTSLHLIGLVSDGGVHSLQEHLFALLRMAKKTGVTNVFIHATLDGRDVPSDSSDIYIEALEIKMAEIGVGKIATLCGRHFTMDKSNNRQLTARAYTMLTHAEGERAFDAVTAIRGFYLRSILDEKIQPIVLESEPNKPVATLKDDDVVIFFNHRGDRMKQLVKAVSLSDFTENEPVSKPKIHTVCLCEYDKNFDLPIAFPPKKVEENTLAQVFADNGVLNCRISETEKYSNITYFFNGGSDHEHPCEQRLLVQTNKDIKPENEPELGSYKITDKLLRGLEAGEDDVFIVNFGAADIIAHKGNFEKTIEAIQHIDNCLGGIVEKIKELKGTLIITADHGNCESMTGDNIGSHTANPVPFHLIDDSLNNIKLFENGALEDVAPTILAILGLKQPEEMTGKDLRV